MQGQERNLLKVSVVKKHKPTTLFVAFFLTAGICNIFTRSESEFIGSIMFCLNAAILFGLILFWMQTVRDRLLPTRSRFNLLLCGALMLVYLLIRVIRYRVLISSNIVGRYTAYLYFIPLLLIPTLLVITGIELSFGKRRFAGRIEYALFASAIVLTLLALTNDLHFLVYRPKVDYSEFRMDGGTYSQGPGFFIIWGWIILNLVAMFFMLFKVMRKKERKIVIELILIVAVWIVLSVFFSLVIERLNLVRMYNPPEINIFCLMLIAECCIRNRLIPYNENYSGFLSRMKVPLIITDNKINVVHESASPVSVSKEILESARKDPVHIDAETRLSGMKIRAGYAFWTENEHELHEEQKRLARANEILNEENDLIAVENRLKEQKARLDAQDQVYENVSSIIRPKQKRIEELLDNIKPGSDSFAQAIGLACVYNAYSKRKTNLSLIDEATLPKSNRELFLALSESARFLKCCGIEAAATGEEYSDIPLSDIHDIYDTFESVIEAYISVLKRMTVSILSDGIRIVMEATGKAELPGTILPVECKESDGLLFFTVRVKDKGGDGK